jgi:hypothetical protein
MDDIYKGKTKEEIIELVYCLTKQNLSGRETHDEIFMKGIEFCYKELCEGKEGSDEPPASNCIKHAVIWRFVHFFGMHKWNFKFSTGHNKYYECEICGKRNVVYPFNGGYQPIDRDWLNRQPDTFNHTSPPF